MGSSLIHRRLLRNALWISLVINSLMFLLGLVRPSHGQPSVLARVSDWLAEPPGFLINRLVPPAGHTPGSVFLAITESIVLSLLFYFVCAWIVLFLWQSVRAKPN